MARTIQLPGELKERDLYGFFDDFDHLIEGVSSAGTATDIGYAPWSETGDAGGEVLLIDGVGGQMTLNTDADDNDEFYFYRTRETFLFAQDRPMYWEARLKYSEAATNAANIIVGVVDAAGANTLLDDGGGPKASYSGMVLFKEDGQTNWSFETSLAGSQDTTRTETVAASSDFVTVGALWLPETSTQGIGVPKIDTGGGANLVQMRDNTDNSGQFKNISHRFTYTSATEMTFVIGIKNGSGNAELVTVDYAGAWQARF